MVVLQRQSWIVVTETVWPTKPKIHGIWPLTEKTGVDLSICPLSHSLCLKNFNSYCSISLLGIDSLSFSCICKRLYLVLTGKKTKIQWVYNFGLTGFILTLQRCLNLHPCNFSNDNSTVDYFHCSVHTWVFLPLIAFKIFSSLLVFSSWNILLEVCVYDVFSNPLWFFPSLHLHPRL